MKDWNDLLRNERVAELGPATSSDIAQRIHLARLAAEESRIPELRPGRRFQILYESACRWSDIVLRSERFRTKGEGHHETLFSSLPHFLGEGAAKMARYLDRCRRRRHDFTYGVEFPPATDQQVTELARVVEELESLVLMWLRDRHPELMTP
jgi:hypothetical protein